MILHIDQQKSLSNIKEEFESNFPGLKIEFVRHAHKEMEGSSRSEIIRLDLNVKELTNGHSLSNLEISSSMRVSEVEQLFREKMGLHIQIFRKTGKNWIETVHTDSWTLNHQMEISAESQHRQGIVRQEIEDFDQE